MRWGSGISQVKMRGDREKGGKKGQVMKERAVFAYSGSSSMPAIFWGGLDVGIDLSPESAGRI